MKPTVYLETSVISEYRSRRSGIRRALLDSGHVTVENEYVYLT